MNIILLSYYFSYCTTKPYYFTAGFASQTRFRTNTFPYSLPFSFRTILPRHFLLFNFHTILLAYFLRHDTVVSGAYCPEKELWDQSSPTYKEASPVAVLSHLCANTLFYMTTKYCSSHYVPSLQTILDLCIPENKLANTHSQISFIYFHSHSWYSVRNYVIPKGIMKTRFEPRLPRMESWKSNKH
jgi:hypothetical protein